jgi:hypothetical protein
MQLLLQCTTQTPQSGEGSLSVDGRFQCFTSEPSVRGVFGQAIGYWEVPGKTAIPIGTYAVEFPISRCSAHVIRVTLRHRGRGRRVAQPDTPRRYK